MWSEKSLRPSSKVKSVIIPWYTTTCLGASAVAYRSTCRTDSVVNLCMYTLKLKQPSHIMMVHVVIDVPLIGVTETLASVSRVSLNPSWLEGMQKMLFRPGIETDY